jgi:hypothetical protein
MDDSVLLEFLLRDYIKIEWINQVSDGGERWTMVVSGLQSIRQFSGTTKKNCIEKAINTVGWWNCQCGVRE